MKTKKTAIAANQEMDIIEVLTSFPDSTAFVFQVGMEPGNYTYYMKLGDPQFTPQDTKYVSVLSTLGFNKQRKELWFGEFFIPRGRELKPITNKQFLDMLQETADIIKRGSLAFNHITRDNFKALGLT